jgi:hypothetical protein
MTLEAPPALSLGETLVSKLQAAAAPLKLADAVKGLARPKKVKPADFKEEVRRALEEEVRQGRAFAASSGKNGETRYWHRDERHLLREKAVELAATPQAMSGLKTKLGKVVKGADGAFVEGLLRELIFEERLYEHPPKTAKGKPLVGTSPPTPPLEQPANQKALGKLAGDLGKLARKAGVSVDAVLAALVALVKQPVATPVPATRTGEAPAEPVGIAVDEHFVPNRDRPGSAGASPVRADAAPSIEQTILAALERESVMSLADLRRQMPPERRGREFDEAVLRLDDQQRVILHRDADPMRFSEAERAELVRDGIALFTTITKRG